MSTNADLLCAPQEEFERCLSWRGQVTKSHALTGVVKPEVVLYKYKYKYAARFPDFFDAERGKRRSLRLAALPQPEPEPAAAQPALPQRSRSRWR